MSGLWWLGIAVLAVTEAVQLYWGWTGRAGLRSEVVQLEMDREWLRWCVRRLNEAEEAQLPTIIEQDPVVAEELRRGAQEILRREVAKLDAPQPANVVALFGERHLASVPDFKPKS